MKIENSKASNWYKQAEDKANQYFQTLLSYLKNNKSTTILYKEILMWKRSHRAILGAMYPGYDKRLVNDKGYLSWLANKGKLDRYLERSISYIYLRDLGKNLSDKETKERITHEKQKLKHSIEQGDSIIDQFRLSAIYRWAQKEAVEEALIWVWNKVNTITDALPKAFDAAHAKRKLIKTIAGVVMQALDDLPNDSTKGERTKQVDKAIRLGYAYGITYPFIDDLLDSDLLSSSEQETFSMMIETAIINQAAPRWTKWQGNNQQFMELVQHELSAAIASIAEKHQKETKDQFFEQAYVFFKSQELDRAKTLQNTEYTNEAIYLPVIVKSASSRLIVRGVLGNAKDHSSNERMFYYGIYNQLSDDFADLFDDMEAGAVTPYTYYLTYKDQRPDLINPFELYWTVITYLIHHVYQADEQAKEVILARAINGLRRFKAKHGKKKYQQIMHELKFGDNKLQRLIQQMVEKATDVDFLDKRLRDDMSQSFRQEQQEKADITREIKRLRQEINELLYFSNNKQVNDSAEKITDAANYSLQGSGKRLRPIMSWMVAEKVYHFDKDAITPLLKSLELMHTASLIFDDLPAQDNATIRRGRPTLHEVYNTALAELTGLFLTQQATYEQASLKKFDPEKVLELIRYASHITAEMCKGQAMDLASKETEQTVAQLETMCYYKTGMGFEASLLMPAILAGINTNEKQQLIDFAYHAGIAFQMKDDLLDVEGDATTLGKSSGMDQVNNRSTFVSLLGKTGARKKMWEHYCDAEEALMQLPEAYHFLHYILLYLIKRVN
ncbi:hypothetical protein Pryu01_02651 [Paraliobacillus ryukyuensis]|uniref:Geranylgeranyl pyrophosphate synthase n=1 Tax=Paraliobacillus ryukyuensis TaxID=200904 RepID=A0A366DYY7_9BACI|nr:polyprenyl synthetase family protein [Paraliobacillus ryukyuensis]RBO95321.1 geranylgeranyl pyrophosphate synthase [Paraliobacillus ryukyuensis]